MSSAPKLGFWAWSFVGLFVATVIVFAAVSEVVLPLLFAAVLAVVFKPLIRNLERRGLKPTLGAGLVVLRLPALMILVVVATVRGVIQQTDEIGGIVGLPLAVPFTVIAGNGIGRLWSRGFFLVVADRAQPTVKQMLN